MVRCLYLSQAGFIWSHNCHLTRSSWSWLLAQTCHSVWELNVHLLIGYLVRSLP